MLLNPTLQEDGSLFLDAYSFSTTELNTVSIVLKDANVKSSFQSIKSDKQGRNGERHIVESNEIPKLEKYLSLKFKIFQKRTTVDLGEEGNQYRCKEITLGGSGNCENVFANDDAAATVKCALVANKNNWFGAVAEPGGCEES